MKLRVLWNAGSSHQGCDEIFILFWCQNLYVYCFFFLRLESFLPTGRINLLPWLHETGEKNRNFKRENGLNVQLDISPFEAFPSSLTTGKLLFPEGVQAVLTY